MPLILSLDTQQASLSLAGGKGANLARLAHAGFPVPPGFILSTDAYTSFVQSHGLHELIRDEVQHISLDDPDALEDTSRTIRAWFGNQ